MTITNAALAFLLVVGGSLILGAAGPIVEVPAIQECEGGETGFPAARVEDGGIVFYLSTEPMPFKGWKPVICSVAIGQMVKTEFPAKEM